MYNTTDGGQVDDPGPNCNSSSGIAGAIRRWGAVMVTRPIPAFGFRTTAGELAVCLGFYRGIRASFSGGVVSQ